jgi:hypothetical protein
MEPFDLNTHIRNEKGQVVKVQPYSIRCEKGKENVYIRNGIEYYENGELVKKPEDPKILKTSTGPQR